MTKKEIEKYLKLTPSEKYKYDLYKTQMNELYNEYNDRIYELSESKLGKDFAKIQNKILELNPEMMELLDKKEPPQDTRKTKKGGK
ncbi:MAG: hypothetical protein ACRCUM_02715 [Mycoplasmoidaceae bacterium]